MLTLQRLRQDSLFFAEMPAVNPSRRDTSLPRCSRSTHTRYLNFCDAPAIVNTQITPRCLAPPFPARSLKIMRRWRRQDQRDVKQ